MSAWHKTMSSRTDKSWKQFHSVLFLSKSGGSLCWKRRFYRQETAVLASRNGASWNGFLFLSVSKMSIVLIICVLCVMLQKCVIRHRTTTCQQISAVFVVRTAFLLILFTASESLCIDERNLTKRYRRRQMNGTRSIDRFGFNINNRRFSPCKL